MRINGALYHVLEDGGERVLDRFKTDDARAMGDWITRSTLEHCDKRLRIVVTDANGELIAEGDRDPNPLRMN